MSLAEVRALIDRHARTGTTTRFGDLILLRETAPGAPAVSPSGTVFAFVAQGAKQLVSGERVLDYGAGEYLIAAIDLPITGRYTRASEAEPALGFGLALDAAEIARLLLADGSAGEPRRGGAAPALAVSTASAELLDAIVRLLRLIDRPRDLAVLGPMIRREIVWLLLTGPQGESVRQLGLMDSALNHIDRTVRWLRDNPERPVRVEQLAALAGLSPSAFHRNFRAVTGATPIQFQKSLRLQWARQLLTARDDDVAAVAHHVGYDSVSQFTREYRRLFGAPPGQDRRRVREGALRG